MASYINTDIPRAMYIIKTINERIGTHEYAGDTQYSTTREVELDMTRDALREIVSDWFEMTAELVA